MRLHRLNLGYGTLDTISQVDSIIPLPELSHQNGFFDNAFQHPP